VRTIELKMFFFSLIDTAGIRETSDKVEKFGVERSVEKLKKAFYKVLVINPLDYDEKNLKDYLSYSPDLIVFTHKDKVNEFAEDLYRKIIGPIEPINDSGPIGANSCYLINNLESNMDFTHKINELSFQKYSDILSVQPIVLDRHKEVLFNLHDLFIEYSKLLKSESDISIISSELTSIGNCISELIGIVSPNDVLHNIFDNFCIGK
jgi:tRNA modification GTPase